MRLIVIIYLYFFCSMEINAAIKVDTIRLDVDSLLIDLYTEASIDTNFYLFKFSITNNYNKIIGIDTMAWEQDRINENPALIVGFPDLTYLIDINYSGIKPQQSYKSSIRVLKVDSIFSFFFMIVPDLKKIEETIVMQKRFDYDIKYNTLYNKYQVSFPSSESIEGSFLIYEFTNINLYSLNRYPRNLFFKYDNHIRKVDFDKWNKKLKINKK